MICIANAGEDEIWTEVDDHDATILIFTSGTTALPKGVQLTYLDMTAYVTNQQPADPELHEKLLVSAPFFHVAGATAMMLAIWSGRTLVILPAVHPGTLAAGGPAGERLRTPSSSRRCSSGSWRCRTSTSTTSPACASITYGAAPMPYEVVRKACDVFSPKGIGLINAYGQTESTATLTFLGPEDHDLSTDTEVKEQRLRSVGKPMPDVELGIMDERNRLLASRRRRAKSASARTAS